MMGKLLAVVLFVCGASTAQASLVPLVTVELVNEGSSVPYHGVWSGYYNANVDGISTPVMCEDFTTWVSLGQTWQAHRYTYADVMGGANTKFSGPQKYSEVGWLFSQTAAATSATRAQIQGAMWNIMSPGSVAMDPLAQSYFNDATSGMHDAFDWSGVMNILTPAPFGSGQEFATAAPVPLPASALLFMSGLAGLLAGGRFGGPLKRRH